MSDEWVTDNRVPSHSDYVWVYDDYYHGVTVGRWTGAWWETADGSDDVLVSAWMEMEKPEAPAEEYPLP